MLDAHVKTAPSDRVSQPSFFVAGQHNEGDGLRGDGAKLGNGQLPFSEDLKQKSLKRLIYLVEFIDKKNARPVAFKRTHQRTGTEEIPPLEVRLYGLPVFMLAS
jgi:hypothetical protein